MKNFEISTKAKIKADSLETVHTHTHTHGVFTK